MHPKSTGNLSAGQPPADLILERLPNGEYAWLRSSTEVAESDDARYTISDAGRRALREADCFGRPWANGRRGGLMRTRRLHRNLVPRRGRRTHAQHIAWLRRRATWLAPYWLRMCHQ